MRYSIAIDEYGFQAELLKLSSLVIGSYLTILFNKVVCASCLEAWSRYTIHLIHKMRLIYDPKNYMTIMIGHIFAKIYATTLKIILLGELDRRNCRAIGQSNFRADYQTMDHILNLWVVIEEAGHHFLKV